MTKGKSWCNQFMLISNSCEVIWMNWQLPWIDQRVMISRYAPWIDLLHKSLICIDSRYMLRIRYVSQAKRWYLPPFRPNFDFWNQFISRGKLTKNNNYIKEWSPSLHVGRIGFALPYRYCAVRIDAYPTVLSFSVLRFQLSTQYMINA